MKKYPVAVLLLSSIIFNSYAQTPDSTAGKVYRDESNKLYVNKNAGIYLWLSTTPDPTGEKILLESDSSKHYSNPMYLDTEGYNTVRSPSAVDTATKKTIYPIRDIIFEVYADGLPPESKTNYTYTSTQMIDGKRYYSGNLRIKISSKDLVSGISKTQVNLNANSFSTYSTELTRVKEGENNLKYFSTDMVGNVEEIKEEIFFVDNTAPKTTYKIEGSVNDKYVAADASIVLSSSDQQAGVKAIMYKINQGNYTTYNNPIPAKLLVGEQPSISFYAVDRLGNKEKIQTIGSKEGIESEAGPVSAGSFFEFYVDREAPELILENPGNSYKGKYNYVSLESQFILTASDTKSGVEKIKYSINSGALDQEYTNPFSLENEGLQYIHASAVDYVGNSSAKIVRPFFCDIQPPKTTLKAGSPKFSSRDTLFISSQTQISLVASDIHSGTKNNIYSISGGKEEIYEKAFTIAEQGQCNISYYSTDQVGNKEVPHTFEVYVDNTPPSIHYHFSVSSIGNKVVRDDNYTIYPTNTMLYIAATDARSGGEKIEYSINGGEMLTINPIKSLAPGNYLIVVHAYDVLGNKSTEEIKFAIEE